MTPLSLERLEIKALRGVVDLSLPLEGKSVVILGENGVGKSSIVDGLEFLFTGRIGALEGTQGLSTARHAPHVGLNQRLTKVTLTVNPGTVSVARTFSQEPHGEGAVATLLSEGSSGNFILRRSQLLKFILTRPAERYQAISPLIGVEELDRRELGLKSLRDDLHGVMIARQAEFDAAGSAATAAVGVAPTDSIETVLGSFNSMRSQNGLAPFGNIAEILSTAVPLTLSPFPAPAPPELGQITMAIGLLPDSELFTRFREGFLALRTATASLLTRRNVDQLPLLDFLRQGHQYLSRAETDICPLCEQPILRDDLIARIMRRIGELDSLSAEATTYRERLAATREDINRIEQRFTELQASLATLGTDPSFSEIATAGTILSRRLRERLSGTEDPRTLPSSFEAEELIEGLRPGCDRIRDSLQQVQARAGARNVDTAVRLATATDALRRWTQTKGSLSESQRAYATAASVFDHFVEARRQGVDHLYAAIQADLNRLYSTLHPGESHRDIVLRPSSERRASTILHLNSFEQAESDPRAYASEAHLDTLGLCIFLAFAKVFLAGFPLLVLDDVLTTVDARHRLRVAEVLMDEFPSTQLLLTTHDEIWFEESRALSRARGLEGRYKFYTITSWTKEGGPDIRQVKPTWELIQGLLAAGDKNQAGNQSRRYAEWITQEICQRTDASLPFSAIGKLELGALLPSAKTRLLELVQDRAANEAFAREFQSIESTTFMANLLSHHNLLAWNLTVDEVRAFATAVNGLESRFSCNGCHSMLVYSRELHELSCSRRTCSDKTRYQTR